MSTLSKSEVQRQINMLNAKANGPGLTDTEREDFDRLCMAHEAMCRAEAQPARSAPTDLPGITAEIRRLARKNRTPAENAKFSALCRQSKSMNASRRAGEARAAKRSAGTTTPTGTTELQRVNADIRRLRAKGDSQTLNEVAHVKNLQRRAETLATAAARASAADDDEVVAQARKVLRQGQAKRGMSMVDPARATPGELRDGALKVLERDGKHLAPFQQDHLDRLLRHSDENSNAATIARRLLITESPAYRSAFRKVMNPAQSPVLDQAESRAVNEFRAANEGTGSAGGFGVPVLIDPTIILTSGASSAELLSMAKTVTITTDQWKGVTASDPAWSWRGEGAVASDSTLTMAQPTIPVYGATGWVEFSVELGQDYPDFAGEMRSLLGQGYIDLVANASVVGSGSSQPTGHLHADDEHDDLAVARGRDDRRAAWSRRRAQGVGGTSAEIPRQRGVGHGTLDRVPRPRLCIGKFGGRLPPNPDARRGHDLGSRRPPTGDLGLRADICRRDLRDHSRRGRR